MGSCKGYSLTELLIVIAMISIVSSAFLSSDVVHYYRTWQARQALLHDVDGLLSLIDRARSLAIHGEQSVILCGGELCHGDWSLSAWAHFSNDQQVQLKHQFSADTTVVWRGFPNNRSYIEFLPTGLSSYQNGSFFICHAQADVLRILVNQSGRAYLDSQHYDVEVCL